MTEEQIAINRLMCGNTAHSCKADYIKLAIDALEKQVPKKPKQSGCTDKNGVFHAINGVPYDLCPGCGENLCTDGFFGADKKYLKYCKNCGQRLDWGVKR